MNKSNCQTCDHKINNPDGGHCYMFQSEPTKTCMIHTKPFMKTFNMSTVIKESIIQKLVVQYPQR